MANFSTKIASTVTASALVASAMSTSLVSAASEFLPYAEALATNKVIGTQSTEAGYRLNDQITRAELAKVAANLGQYTAVSCTGTVFTDVNKNLGDLCDAIETLAAAKVVSTSSSTFRPAANVTRAEMVKMLLGAVGEKPSATSAGYADVSADLGDLAGFINRAAEMGVANKATYFRPAANSSRGEAFKIAAKAANLNVTTTTTTNTGTTNTGTVVNTGNLAVSTVGSAVAQYVPMNASSVKVGTIKVTATGGDATINTLTVTRSGLGVVNGLKASLAQNGVIVGNARSFNNTTQESVIRLNTPLVLKNGSSVEFDVLASLSDLENANSQHQFSVSAANGAAITPVTLGLINTTSYKVETVKTTELKTESVRSGLSATRIASIKVEAPGSRDVTVHAITISKNTGNDLSQAIANVKVFRNGVDTGAKATVTSDKIVITGLNTKLASGNVANYELRADTIYVGETAKFGLYVANTEDITATEDATSYTTRVDASATATATLDDPKTEKVNEEKQILTITGIKVTTTLNDSSLKTVAPGASAVNLLDGKITSSASFEVRGFELTPTIASASGTVDQDLKDIFSSLSLDIAGSNYDLLANTTKGGKYTFGNSEAFIMDAGVAANVRVRGTLKTQIPTNFSNIKFALKITSLKNLDNGNTFPPSTTVELTGNNLSIKAASLNLRAASVAAPSTKNISSNVNGVEIGRFALEAKNELVRVDSVIVTASGTILSATGALKSLADNESSFRLVDLSTGAEIEASKEFNENNNSIKFTFSPSVSVAKDTIKNIKLTVDTKNIEGRSTIQPIFSVEGLNADSGSSVTASTNTYTNAIVYTTSIVTPVVTVSPITLSTSNGTIANVRVANNDNDNNLKLETVTLKVRAAGVTGNSRENLIASGATVCIRNLGATTCADGVEGKLSNGEVTFTIPAAMTAGTEITTNSSVDFEVYLDNAPLWMSGDIVRVSVEKATYKYGTSSVTNPLEETYNNVAGAFADSKF